MLAWKPLQESTAFRLYCKGIGMDIKDYDHVAMNLDDYRESPEWKPLIDESKVFVGVVESVAESPCSMLLYDKPVRRKIGIVRTKTRLCCLLDGYNCDKYKYLKNDYLTTIVWDIISKVCKLANIKIPSIMELESMLDEKTFAIYDRGLTCTINQVDSEWATGLIQRFKPRSLKDMSGFVAIVRPGCASLLDDYIDRKPYTTGVPALDEILTDGEHRMIYQELIMKYLIWLGIKETGSYDIIKKIAKKKFKEAELAALKKELEAGWIKQVCEIKGFAETWQVVQDAAKYSFNASHSLSYALDSLYGAYLKSHYPLEYYTVVFETYAGDFGRTARLTKECACFGIKLESAKFGMSGAGYVMDRDTNTIYKGVQSIKELNAAVGNELYNLRANTYNDFIDLLFDINNKTSADKTKITVLIKSGFFEEYGDINYLLACYDMFRHFVKTDGKTRSQFSKDDLDSDTYNIIKKYSNRETEKQFREVDIKSVLRDLCKRIQYDRCTLSEKCGYQLELFGYVDIKDDKYSGLGYIVDIDTKYSPRLTIYSLKNGTNLQCKIPKRTFNMLPLKQGDIVRIGKTVYKPKSKLVDNEWVPIDGSKELWVNSYRKINA